MNPNYLDTLWTPFSTQTDFISFYEEGLEKANNGLHDNIRKRYRFFSLFQLVHLSLKNNNNYHFAECGCFKGHSTYIISSILQQYKFEKNFFIFDSFEGGLSSYSDQDRIIKDRTISIDEENVRRKKFSNNYIDFLNLIKPFEFTKVFNGWIPNDFHNIENYQFQFVHLDVDLYQPTYDSLNFFFPRLVKGGIIICDDYNFLDFPGAKIAWDEYFEDKDYSFSYEVPLGSKFLIK
jgi:O-methyltransferase